MDMGITNNSNVGPISPIQNTGKVNKTGGTGNELEFHSSPEVLETLKSGRGDVNRGAINELNEGVKKGFADGSHSDLLSTHDRNSLILSQLVHSKAAVDGAAEKVAKAYQNAGKKPSLGGMMTAMVGLPVLESEKDKGNG